MKAGRCVLKATASKPPARSASIDVPDAKIIDLGAATLMPGLVEGHSHMLLHAYSETSWNDQVEHEPPGAARRPRHQSSSRHPDGRLHHHPRLGHRRRGLCRRRAKAGGQPGHHSRPANAGRHARHRRHRNLRPQRIRPRMARPARRRRDLRPGHDSRRARPDRPRRGLDQTIRRLSLGPPSRRRIRRFRSKR